MAGRLQGRAAADLLEVPAVLVGLDRLRLVTAWLRALSANCERCAHTTGWLRLSFSPPAESLP